MRRRSKEIRIAVAVSDFVKLDLVNNPTLIMFSLIECEFILRVNIVGGKAMVKRADIFHSNLMCICIFVFVKGVSKKRYFLGFCLISLLEVRFYFFTCVSESEFRAHFI